MLAEDVKYNFECLGGPGASPEWQTRMAGVARVVELGDTEAVFSAPQHAYTQALLSAVHLG